MRRTEMSEREFERVQVLARMRGKQLGIVPPVEPIADVIPTIESKT